ncbi:L-threonylcarbamoyladenylate synthase [Lacihabitans sp. CS3-21]|uniref:L-threonylcarbamoyladenylate synthase n=1 Tax=Lacihabitans sp. CS3-21 TaxID=2487332 RepID=UPI0020CCAAF0|nr:L-threonylcarbamoyladenylate synthase [Lacihabitans sp. CS3-21]MCP9748292.1 threonylcarbamoyl-AMP synthase [Lacihabitans sp. CS3-21]
MAAELVEVFPDNPDYRVIDKIVSCLKNGGVIIYPTDTVYSMGCDSSNVKAVERLCKLKNIKPSQNKFSIVCSDLRDISTYAKVSNEAFRLMKRLLPGPFTFIMPSTGDLPKILQTNRKTIGIRVPDHKVPNLIIQKLGHPIITTSVKDDIDDIVEYPNEIELLFDQNQHKVDMIVDAGWCGVIPSTVVDATESSNIHVLREGLGEVGDI